MQLAVGRLDDLGEDSDTDRVVDVSDDVGKPPGPVPTCTRVNA
jgi:hypothetical protein